MVIQLLYQGKNIEHTRDWCSCEIVNHERSCLSTWHIIINGDDRILSIIECTQSTVKYVNRSNRNSKSYLWLGWTGYSALKSNRVSWFGCDIVEQTPKLRWAVRHLFASANLLLLHRLLRWWLHCQLGQAAGFSCSVRSLDSISATVLIKHFRNGQRVDISKSCDL